jgi:hypothetical protein
VLLIGALEGVKRGENQHYANVGIVYTRASGVRDRGENFPLKQIVNICGMGFVSLAATCAQRRQEEAGMKSVVRSCVVVGGIASALWTGSVLATPRLQVYMQGSVAADQTSPFTDQDTWVAQGGAVTLDLMAYYSNNNIASINDGYLVISAPQAQPLAVQWSYAAGGIGSTSISSAYLSSHQFAGDGAFETWLQTTSGFTGAFNNHSPYGTDPLVDIYAIRLNDLAAGLGDFAETSVVPDCNASVAGTATCGAGNPNRYGEIKSLGLTLTGVDWAHFDLVALITTNTAAGPTSQWEINPGSHDATWTVPLPPTAWLIGAGVIALGLVRARRESC